MSAILGVPVMTMGPPCARTSPTAIASLRCTAVGTTSQQSAMNPHEYKRTRSNKATNSVSHHASPKRSHRRKSLVNDQKVYLRNEAPLEEALRSLPISKGTVMACNSEKKHKQSFSTHTRRSQSNQTTEWAGDYTPAININ